MEDLMEILKHGIRTENQRELMGNSLLYYCCGADISPVIAYGAKIPLYVYNNSGREDKYADLMNTMIERGFLPEENRLLENEQKIPMFASKWFNKNGFYVRILYTYEPLEKMFHNLYVDTTGHIGIIRPKYVCNLGYAFNEKISKKTQKLLKQIERQAEYIIGFCSDKKYKEVETIERIKVEEMHPEAEENNFEANENMLGINVYQRRYWYM